MSLTSVMLLDTRMQGGRVPDTVLIRIQEEQRAAKHDISTTQLANAQKASTMDITDCLDRPPSSTDRHPDRLPIIVTKSSIVS